MRRAADSRPKRTGTLSDRSPRPAARGETSTRARSYLTRGRPRVVSVSDSGGTALVMVGPLRGPEHLALVHRHGDYHVPAAAIASSRAAVAYIAFYEGAGRFAHPGSRIREYAAVVGVCRVRRRDLPGLTWPGARGDDSPYYRFDLGAIQTLPQPVTNPDRIRVVFRFLDLGRLRRAATVREMGDPRPGPAPADRRKHARAATPGGRASAEDANRP